MNTDHVDDMTRMLTILPSRRDVLRGLAGAGLGLGAFRFRGATEAKKRKNKHKKHKPKKATPNEFGCLEVGDPCKTATQCCSGVCEGKKGKKRCRAHGNGTCNQTIQAFCAPDNPTISLCNSADCVCVRTTAGSNFCTSTQGVQCADCTRDADCEALGFLPGSACLPWSEGQCAGDCGETGMACAVPCGAEITGPIT
jgi:hypothetical protein